MSTTDDKTLETIPDMAKPVRPLSARIRELMEEHRLEGSTELGDFLRVSRQTANSWMKGSRLPYPVNLFRIADAFQISVRWLALEQGPKDILDLPEGDAAELVALFNRLEDAAARRAVVGIVQTMYQTQQKHAQESKK